MGDRRIKYPLLWLGFIAVMVTGAAMMLSRDATVQTWGIILLAAPIVGFGAVAAVYYLLERFRATQ